MQVREREREMRPQEGGKERKTFIAAASLSHIIRLLSQKMRVRGGLYYLFLTLAHTHTHIRALMKEA